MNLTLQRAIAGLLAAFAAVLLPGCKSVDVPKVPGITPYRMVIQQGNFISQEMVAQLKPGMSKEQVRFILGTPLVTDIFHADRWDYVFFREEASGKREQRNLSVVFDKEKLVRVIGDLMPADGATPQAGGFTPLQKPEPKPEAAAKPAAKPAAAASRAAPEMAQPTPITEPNWRSGGDAAQAPPPPPPEPTPVAKEEETKPADAKKEPGFLERLREKMGL